MSIYKFVCRSCERIVNEKAQTVSAQLYEYEAQAFIKMFKYYDVMFLLFH